MTYKVNLRSNSLSFKCKNYYGNGNYGKTLILNNSLIIKKKLSLYEINRLIETYRKLYRLYNKIRKDIENNKKIDYAKCLNRFHELQYDLQFWWRFRKNRNYHRFWELPGCLCPDIDNLDRYPLGSYYYDGACPYHSGFIKRIKQTSK